MTEQELIERAIESAKCRIYRVRANVGESLAHQVKADNQAEIMQVTIDALEKQIAKKPIEGSFGVQCCPCCNEKVGQRVTRTLYENRMNYCGNCGIRIDWGNEDAE